MGDKIVGFGGLNNEAGWLDSLVALQLSSSQQSFQWLPTPPNNAGPTPRDKLSSIALGNDKLVIFGGFGPTELEDEDVDIEDEDEDQGPTADFIWFNDVWVLDVTRWEWHSVQVVGQSPTPRAAAAMAHVGGGVGYLFGGRGATGRLDDFYRFTLSESATAESGRFKIVWEVITAAAGSSSSSSAAASKPSARSFHSMAAVSPNRLVLYGGMDVNDVQLNDLHIYDIERQAWYKPSGYQRLDSIAQVLIETKPPEVAANSNSSTTPAPPAPFSHKGGSTKMAYDEKNRLLYLFGGSSSTELLVINAKPIVELPSSSLPSQS